MNKNRLLIVDDEKAFGAFVAAAAADLGYDSLAIDDPQEFWRHVEGDDPTVIVLDLHMPGVDGIEILRDLGIKGSRAKVVLASGLDSRTLDTARRLGHELGLDMAGAIRKPIQLAALNALLGSLRKAVFEVSPATLREAIAGDRLFLAFQPQIDLISGRVTGVEALARWRAEDGGIIYPDAFIPMAEREGLIGDVFQWVLKNAIAEAGRWHAAGLPLQLAINVSARNIHDRGAPDLIAGLCRGAGLPPGRLVLELTETATMQDSALMMEVLTRFRVKGFKLSIDDFGTGYSSLVQLLRLPFSEIKIDKSFVIEMDRVLDSAIVVKTITEMGHNLKLAVVAEGVESERSMAMLRNLRCDLGQGFLFAKPMPANDVAAFVAARAEGAPAVASLG